jgi:hypothetical protein
MLSRYLKRTFIVSNTRLLNYHNKRNIFLETNNSKQNIFKASKNQLLNNHKKQSIF